MSIIVSCKTQTCAALLLHILAVCLGEKDGRNVSVSTHDSEAEIPLNLSI